MKENVEAFYLRRRYNSTTTTSLLVSYAIVRGSYARDKKGNAEEKEERKTLWCHRSRKWNTINTDPEGGAVDRVLRTYMGTLPKSTYREDPTSDRAIRDPLLASYSTRFPSQPETPYC